jgi:DNA-binding response OmpR family regulator
MLTKVESSRIVATDCNSGHVLVVDDDPAVRHLISDYFGQHGIQTVSAMGRSAVARQVAGGDTSAIILDLHLRQDNGLDLLREIRSGSDVPVVILTGRSRDEVDCVVGLELGADDYLTKPFGIRELYAPLGGLAHHTAKSLMVRASRFTLVSEADLAPSTVNRDGTAVSARRFTSVPGTFETWRLVLTMSVPRGRAEDVGGPKTTRMTPTGHEWAEGFWC